MPTLIIVCLLAIIRAYICYSHVILNCFNYSLAIVVVKVVKPMHKMTSTVFSHSSYNILLSMLVPNSKDRQRKLWLPIQLGNNLTITCPSSTGHESLYTEQLAR